MTAASDAARARLRRRGARSVRGPGLALATLLVLALTTAGCDDDPMMADPECLRAIPLLPGTPADGALSARDAFFNGARIDYYAMNLADSATVELTLASDQLDPLLLLFQAPGAVRAQAFDSAGAPDGETETARLHQRLGPGCHLIGATSWQRARLGGYSLLAETVLDDDDDGPDDDGPDDHAPDGGFPGYR